MRLVVDLTLPNEARMIARTRRIFSGYMEELGADRQDVNDVVLALDEACTNVVRHAYAREGELFRLTAELTADEVVLTVEDDGVGMSGDGAQKLSDPSATSGRGLHIIREVMTSVEVQTSPARQGTRLHMRKSLKTAGF